jgi:hypothetical protein
VLLLAITAVAAGQYATGPAIISVAWLAVGPPGLDLPEIARVVDRSITRAAREEDFVTAVFAELDPGGWLQRPGDRASPTSGSGIRTVDVLFAWGEH